MSTMQKFQYKCGKQHKFVTDQPYIMRFTAPSSGIDQAINYCPLCFGDWLSSQFPVEVQRFKNGEH